VTAFSGMVLGWLIYMVAMIFTVYDGALSLIFQPIMAAFFSFAFVLAALIVGLPLRIPAISRVWSRIGWWAVLISVASICVLVFDSKLGLRETVLDPNTKKPIETIKPLAGVLAYFFAIFPIVNLPRKIRPNQSTDPTPASGTPPAGQESRHP
jgi:hypothetical protein